MMTSLRLFLLCALATPAVAQTATFEDPTLAVPLTGPNTFQNGSGLGGAPSFTAAGFTFNNSYNATWQSWSGWSYSNVSNATTAGFGNQYAVYTPPVGAADGGTNYGVATSFSPGGATIVLPAGTLPTTARIANTTYAALSMRDGDSFAKKFGGVSGNDPDYFKLTVTGKNAAGGDTGTVDFYLADFRSANNAEDYIVSAWTTVDLTGLGPDTVKLSFGLESSDVGTFGMNTPAYFALDNLTVVPVPEPAAVGLVGLVLVWVRRRGRILAK